MTSIIHEERAWCVIDETAVFLDIARDRYFRLPPHRNRGFVEQAGSAGACQPCQPASLPLAQSWQPAVRQACAIDGAGSRIGDVARAIWLQRRAERQLATRSLASNLSNVRTVLMAQEGAPATMTPRVSQTIQAFERARLLRSTANRCLPRSIALALSLAREGCRAHVVLGVRLAPFTAHCWTQVGDAVASDEIEAVRLYTPILVL